MATYKGIKGVKVVTKTSDPTASEALGTVWYNSTSPTALKYSIQSAGAWAAGNNLNTPHGQMGIVGGTPAALCFGGISTDKNTCESFDGSSWSVANTLNQGRSYNAGFGSTTAAVTVGGSPQAVTATETWNGSTWTAVPGVLSTGRQKFGTANNGTTTAGLIFGGQNTPGPPWYSLALVESWDGTSWTAVPGVLASGRQKFGTSNNGTTTAGLIFAGQNTPGPPWYSVDLVEEWDGTSWTAKTAVTTAREAGGGVGIQTASLTIAGYTGTANSALVEEWNGTAWSEEADVNTARQSVCCSGTITSALIGGGAPLIASTEQWNGTAWTEVADLGTGREGMGKGAGASGNVCIGVGADGPAPTAILTELWDGAPAVVKTVTTS